MEIEGGKNAQSGDTVNDLDYLFEFSPESPRRSAEQRRAEQFQLATGEQLENKDQTCSQSGWIDQRIPEVVRGSSKKQKFVAEMKTTNKLEKSRQSARECRARKKLRYQYLDDMIAERERANDVLRDELIKYVSWCQMMDQNKVPDGLSQFLASSDYQEDKC